MPSTDLGIIQNEGTAAAPSAAFLDEPGTGTYRISGGGWGLAVSGIEEMRATTDGITFAKPTRSSAAAGTPGTGVTAVEVGDGAHMRVTLTLTDFAVGNSGDNVAKALGAVIYTLPAGVFTINSAYLTVGVTIADANTTQTPEIGLGTVVGSGANATLGAVGATSENILEGSATADCAGTAEVVSDIPTANVPIVIAAAGSHDIFLNLAATWADMTAAAALTATGTVVVDFTKLA